MTDKLRLRGSVLDGAWFDALHRLADSFILPLCKLNQIQFEAPWKPSSDRCGSER